MITKMEPIKLIDLCRYTATQAIHDTGDYFENVMQEIDAQDIIDNLNLNGGKNGKRNN